MTVFTGGAAIEEFLEELDGWLSAQIRVYLLGGSAMTARGLKDQTEDIDLALGVAKEFDHVYETLVERGFEVSAEPTAPFDDIGTTVELHHPERGVQVDLFERQVVGKVWVTERMHERAEAFWRGEHATAYLLADEDMFLFKAVSAGDIGSGRRRDIEDMRIYAQRGLDFELILEEIDEQRPFNTGPTEAQQIRDRSHPLIAIETAVESLSGLPVSFTEEVSAYGTAFEIEYFVLGAVDEGVRDVETIRRRVVSNVRELPADSDEAVEVGLDRLVEKGVLTWTHDSAQDSKRRVELATES
jgi:hypothetical protein